MTVALNKNWEEYVAEQIGSGEFKSATDVVEDALRLQQEYLRKRDLLRREIDKGIASAEAGQISHATADEIIAKAKLRMKKSA